MNLSSREALLPVTLREGLAPLKMPTVYTSVPVAFMVLAVPMAREATSDSNPLDEVGEPSVKKMTTFFALLRAGSGFEARAAWARSKPKSARVAPLGLMDSTVFFSCVAPESSHTVRFCMIWE